MLLKGLDALHASRPVHASHFVPSPPGLRNRFNVSARHASEPPTQVEGLHLHQGT